MNEYIEFDGTTIVPEYVVAPIVVIDDSIVDPRAIDVRGKIALIRAASPDIVIWLRHASGIIIEKGGITSHGAILAREFNVPCIIGIPGIFDNAYNEKTGQLMGAEGKLRIWD